MLKKIGLAVLFLALGTVSALAADFNGKWNGDVTTPRGTQTLIFDFHVDGATLTGKVTTPRGDTDITNGKVDGDNISFDTVMNFNGNEFTINYTGKADGKSRSGRSSRGRWVIAVFGLCSEERCTGGCACDAAVVGGSGRTSKFSLKGFPGPR